MQDLQAAKQPGLSCSTTGASQLKVESKVVANVAKGTRLLVTDVNDEWLWAELASDRSKKGWIKKQFVSPLLPPDSTLP